MKAVDVRGLAQDEAHRLYDELRSVILGSEGAYLFYDSAMQYIYTLPVNKIFAQEYDNGDEYIAFDELRGLAAALAVSDPTVIDRLESLDMEELVKKAQNNGKG